MEGVIRKELREELISALDKEVSKEKRLWIFAIVVAILFALGLTTIFTPFSSETKYGIMLSYSVRQSDFGSIPKVRVELDNGHKVLATSSRRFPYIEGARVEMIEERSLIGKPRYKIIRLDD